MNLIPLLNPFHNIRMIFAEFLTEFMKLPEKSTPSFDYGNILHPSKFNKSEGTSFGPLENSNDKTADHNKHFMRGFFDWELGGAQMIDSCIDQVLNEKEFISNSLKMFVVGVWCNSNRELLLAIFREGLKSVILGGFDELAQL